MRGAPGLVLLGWFVVGTAGAEEGRDTSPDEGDDDDSAAEPAAREIHDAVVVTATGQPRLLSDSPIPVRLVDEREVTNAAGSDAAELLQRVPGVPSMAGGIDERGGAAGLSLQGAGAGRTRLLLDGRPLAGDVGGVVDLSELPAEMLERVEIVEGPMSALYGSDALGGVVNLVTKRPRPGTLVGARFQGATDRSLHGGLHVAAGLRQGYGFSATSTIRREEAQDLDKADVATDLDARTSFGLRVLGSVFRLGQTLEASAMFTHDRRDGVVLRRNEAIDFESVWDSPKVHDRLVLSLRGDHPREHGGIRWFIDGTDYAASLTNDLRGSPVIAVRRSRMALLASGFRGDLRVVPEAHAAFGLDLQREWLRISQDRFDPGSVIVHLDDVPGSSEGRLEPWVQGDFRLFADRLELLPGFRVSWRQGLDPAIAPSLALRLRLWEGASLRLSGGRGYKAPSLKDRYMVFDHAALGYIVYGNPELVPESSWGANVSLEQRKGPVALRLGGFGNRLSELIAYVYDGAASTSGQNVYRAANIEGARTVGADVHWELRTTPFRATAAYRFLLAWDDAGEPLPDAPQHALRVTLEGTIPKAEIVVSTLVSFESDRLVDTASGLRSPASFRWDARIARTIDKKHAVTAWIGVDNILNLRRDPDREGDFRAVDGISLHAGVRGALRFPARGEPEDADP